MATGLQRLIERAHFARAAAMLVALALLAAAGWLAWKHGIDAVIALDAERTLTLVVFLVANAVVLYAAAQPARYLNRPLDARAALRTTGAAAINVGAAAFFAINAAFAVQALTEPGAPIWLAALLVPAAAALLVFLANFGVPPEGGDDISDEDIAEAALILTESQRRWSWASVFEMAGFMAATRTLLLGVYFVWLVAGMAMFEWLSKAFLETQALSAEGLRTLSAAALVHGNEILGQTWFWTVFVLVAVVPPVLILSAAIWYRVSVRRERMRLRTLSQSPAKWLMTGDELLFLKRRIERPMMAALAAAKQQRTVS